MTTYRQIHGRSIQAVTTDPTVDVAEGQIWYNTTSDAFKSVLISNAWVSTTALPQATSAMAAGFGTQTDGVVAGGFTPPNNSTNLTHEYNGTGWSAGGNLNTARHSLGSLGVETAGLCFGGKVDPGGANPANVEEYNGSTWSEVTDQPQALQNAAGAGIQTAGISIGGQTGPSFPARITNSYHYDGTNWTDGGALPAATTAMGAGGTLTATVAFGGNIAPDNMTGNTYEYNGSSWTSSNSMNTSRSELAGCGSQTAALAFGGNTSPAYTAYSAKTEEYDGTTWSETTDLPTATLTPAGFGTQTAALSAGGANPSATAVCNEWNKSINVFTAAAFSSGGNLNTARYDIVGTGLQTAAVAAGGYSSSRTGATENYDGSAWTNSSTKPTAVFAGGMVGTQTAAFYASGNNAPSGGRTASTEEYDGSNWTSGGNVNTARQQIGAQNGGTLTAGIIFGGNGGPTATEHYDGTSWTTQPATLNDGRWNAIGTGNQTAAVMAGADNPATANVEEYNGTSWSEVNNLPEVRYSGATIGTAQTDYIVASGQAPPGFLTSCVRYDGTNWATSPSNSTARSLLGGSSQVPTSAGLIYGGYTVPGNKADTEEWNGETSSINVKTLTQS